MRHEMVFNKTFTEELVSRCTSILAVFKMEGESRRGINSTTQHLNATTPTTNMSTNTHNQATITNSEVEIAETREMISIHAIIEG